MFPRLHRIFRVALLALVLLLFLVLMLRTGGQDKVIADDTEIFLRRQELSPALHGLLPSTVKRLYLSTIRLQEPTVHPSSSLEDSAAPSTAEVIRNPHTFSYLLNPVNACKSRDGNHVFMLVFVHAAPANFKKRQSIRQTWGDADLLRRYNATLVFIMGRVDEKSLMDLVRMESDLYGDIVQEDFLDSYRNLTYKAIAGLKWAATYCSRAAYILKTDDDILVNMHKLIQYIRTSVIRLHEQRRLILCNQWLRMKIIRDKNSKWYIPESEFQGEYFPPYCSGSAFILSGDMAKAMYEASLKTPFFWVDDYYITGSLIKQLGITQMRLNSAYMLNPTVAEGKFRNDTDHQLMFFHLHKLALVYRLWRNMTSDYLAAIKSSVTPLLEHVSNAV